MPYMLNSNWQIIKKISTQKAVKKVLKERALFLDKDTGETFTFDAWRERGTGKEWVRFGKGQIPKPEFIILTYYSGLGLNPIKEKPRFSRYNIYVRDGGHCAFCGKFLPYQKGGFTFDHIHPKSRGGPKDWNNIVLACPACNRKKANKHLSESGLKLRVQPYEPTPEDLRNKNIKMRLEIWKHEDSELTRFV